MALIPKVQATKDKIDKLKSFSTAKKMINRAKRKTYRMGEKFLQSIHLIISKICGNYTTQ